MAEPARYAGSHAKGDGSAISTVLHRLASDLGKLMCLGTTPASPR